MLGKRRGTASGLPGDSRATAGRPHRDARRTEAPPHRLADDRVAGGAQYQETLSFYTVVDAVIDRYS